MFRKNYHRTFGWAFGLALSFILFIGAGIIYSVMHSKNLPAPPPAPAGTSVQGTTISQQVAISPAPNVAGNLNTTTTNLPDTTMPANTANSLPNFVDVVKKSIPGVVGITVTQPNVNTLFDSAASAKVGVGSGVILSPDGFILTNNHVTDGKSANIRVSIADGREAAATKLWTDPVLDLALIKVDLTNLPSIPVGDAKSLQVGEPVLAIGNPLGLQLQRTVTSGIVSALNRTIKVETANGTNYMEDLIQTDAGINPGNSGGPLLNSRGEVIGINSVKVASAEALSFAIPINIALPIIKQYVTHGNVKEPFLGVMAYKNEISQYISPSTKGEPGIIVTGIDNKSPAFASGIREGCIIQSIDDHPIDSMLALREYLYTKRPGDTVTISCLNSNKKEKLVIVLDTKYDKWNNTR